VREEIKKKHPYWLTHDCFDCVEAYEARQSKMKRNVRGNAQRLREEFGLPSPEVTRREARGRCEHMDVGR